MPILARIFFLAQGLALALPLFAQNPQYAFTNLAGWPGGEGYVDGPLAIAQFGSTRSPVMDRAGNIYVADYNNNLIRKISAQGIVSTMAGQAGVVGSADGQGTAAQFNGPFNLVLDAEENLYVSDVDNHTIRKISPAGRVTTVAGTPKMAGHRNGVGAAAQFRFPQGLALDAQGNVLIADSSNHAIRKLAPDGLVTTLAGVLEESGSQDAPIGHFNKPGALMLDKAGNIVVADTGNHSIRLIDAQGRFTTLAGASGISGAMDGPASEARFNRPTGLALDLAGNIYVADSGNDAIRVIPPTGGVTTLAGQLGVGGYADGLGSDARFDGPACLLWDKAGLLYVSDLANRSIRKVRLSGEVTTLVGSPAHPGAEDGLGRAATFNKPGGIAVDAAGNAYVSDNVNSTLRLVTPEGRVTTPAGKAGEKGDANGYGDAARFTYPAGLAVDSNGNVFLADAGTHTIRVISHDGYVSTLAGSSQVAGYQDGKGAGASFNTPGGLALDMGTTLYVADTLNHAIRKISILTGAVTTLAGGSLGSLDGTGRAAQFHAPNGVAVGPKGEVYVGDTANHTIRKVTPAGEVTTIAGLAGVSGSVDGTGSAARFTQPFGLAVDAAGNVFVCDYSNSTIRKVTPQGVVTTVGGSPRRRAYTDGIGMQAGFSTPWALALDSAGDIYVADTFNHRITKGTLLPGLLLSKQGGQAFLTIAAGPEHHYAVEYSSQLDEGGGWQSEPTLGTVFLFQDRETYPIGIPDGQGQRFYRVRPLP